MTHQKIKTKISVVLYFVVVVNIIIIIDREQPVKVTLGYNINPIYTP